MAQPTPTDLFVNVPLTNLSVAFIQDDTDFIATQVFPFVGVPYQGGEYFRYIQDNWFRDDAQLRTVGSESAGGGFELTEDSFFIKPYAWHMDIGDQQRGNQMPPIDLQMSATQLVTKKLLIRREALFMKNYFATGIWTDVTGVGAAPSSTQVVKWSVAGSTPVDDIDLWKNTVKRLTGYLPNVLVLTPDVYVALKNHPEVIDRIKYGGTPGNPAFVNMDALASLFGVEKVVVAWATQALAQEHASTQTYGYIAGTAGALLIYAAPSPGILTPSAGYTFGWTGYMGAGAEGNRIKSFRIEQIEATRIEGTIAVDPHVISPALGVFFSAVV